MLGDFYNFVVGVIDFVEISFLVFSDFGEGILLDVSIRSIKVGGFGVVVGFGEVGLGFGMGIVL